jgi:endonuclease YncB( thermonuclease family)
MTAFDSTDKQGGFIGAMYLGGSNVAVELVREGLASVHSFSADGLPFGRELASAEEEAKAAKKNVSPSCASIDNAHSSFGPTTPAKKSRSKRMILLLLRPSISMSTFRL